MIPPNSCSRNIHHQVHICLTSNWSQYLGEDGENIVAWSTDPISNSIRPFVRCAMRSAVDGQNPFVIAVNLVSSLARRIFRFLEAACSVRVWFPRPSRALN